jgi:hypothetical protein
MFLLLALLVASKDFCCCSNPSATFLIMKLRIANCLLIFCSSMFVAAVAADALTVSGVAACFTATCSEATLS